MKLWGQPTKGRSKEPSQPSQKERPTTNARDTCDRCDASTYTEDKKDSKKTTAPSPDQSIPKILGMTEEQAIAIWDKQGRPVIHLGAGENCERLDLLLSNPNVLDRHLEAVRTWLEKRTNKLGEPGQ